MEESLIQYHHDCLRFVLFGPESTGKTTLAQGLALRYDTRWVEEQMRIYLQEKLDRTGLTCMPEDILPIGKRYIRDENAKASQGKPFIFCDANLLQLEAYSEYYYEGFCPEPIRQANKTNRYAHYFLTDIDVPWVADDLRDRPHNREELFTIFEHKLRQYNQPYSVLSGTLEQRMEKARAIIEQIA